MKTKQERPYVTALFGFGNIAQGYLSDPLLRQCYKYLTHAQVLTEHPSFELRVVVDSSKDARNIAREKWNIQHVLGSVLEAREVLEEVEIAVISTPPEFRIQFLNTLPNLKAIIVEKPLGLCLKDSQDFQRYCDERNIVVQVNYWRRSDLLFRSFAKGYLKSLVGKLQGVHAIYGNGILNNGSHMVDFSRMLFGELSVCTELYAESQVKSNDSLPIRGDIDVGFSLVAREHAVTIHYTPVDFESYRENGLSIWGTTGRLEIMNEGLTIRYYPVLPSRSTSGSLEISHDKASTMMTTVGTALFELYSNLIASMCGESQLHSPGSSALKTEEIIDKVLKVAKYND